MMDGAWSSSHSLAELNGIVKSMGVGTDINVTQTAKESVVLDHYYGLTNTARYDVRTGLVGFVMGMAPDMMKFHEMDPDDEDDWDYLKECRADDTEFIRRINDLLKAIKLCKLATKLEPADPRYRDTLERAIACSDLCAQAHVFLYDAIAMGVESFGSHDEMMKTQKELNIHLIRAVKAGRRLKETINADSICKGRLFSFVATRWYMRSLFVLGGALFGQGDLDGAEPYFKECMANDIHDKLGARHKQLLINLERAGGVHGAEIKFLLKARFGEDQKPDELLALWNYTRALYSFHRKGRSKSSEKLLKHAIEKNPSVPPLLLSWKIPTYSPVFMRLGGEMEGSDYIKDNAKYWMSEDGALEWLEDYYCQLTGVSPPFSSNEARVLLIEGTKLMTDAQNARGPCNTIALRAAIEKFGSLLGFLSKDVLRQKQLRMEVLQRKGICHSLVGEYDTAIPHINSSLYLCDTADKDAIKGLYYHRASAKESNGDLRGAYDDYKFVFERIGKFTTAADGVRRLERKLQIEQSAIPEFEYPPGYGLDESREQMRDFERMVAESLPKLDRQDNIAATQERCSRCKRGGIKLFKCSGCCDPSYVCCSEECQAEGWRAVHKYTCKGSKHRLEAGTRVRLRGLNKAEYNGKIATVCSFMESKERFCVDIDASEGKTPTRISIKPINLKKLSTQ